MRSRAALPWRAKALYAATISSSLAPAPPRISDRFGSAPAGSIRGNPALRKFAAKRLGP
jgi:hypothetical protein